ncbi:hypothetical protein E5F65_23930, partial [Shigella sonnei]
MALQNEKNSRYLLRDWKPENPAFWENKGKHIARRNLWISVSCLLLAFCVWMLFSAVGFAPIFPDICYHLTHYKPAAADIPVASDNPAHYADAIRYNA